jgi:hypothetical protein
LSPWQLCHYCHHCELYSKQPLTPPQHNIIAAYLASNHIYLPLKLDNGRLSLPLEILDYTTFCSYDAIENESHFVLKCPMYHPIRDTHYLRTKFWGASSVSLNQTIKRAVNLYLTKATTLHHSRELASWFETILMYFQFHEPFTASRTFKINYLSLNMW